MSDKKDQDNLENEDTLKLEKKEILNEEVKNSPSKKKMDWGFCPSCGNKLPEIDRLRFCTRCGIDLQYLKEHKTLPPQHQQPKAYTQYENYPKYPQYSQNAQYPVTYGRYRPFIEKISDEDLTNTKNRKLWGKLASLGIPLAGFVVMNAIVLGFIVLIALFTLDYESLYNLITSNFFIVLTSLFEFILILLPLIYVRKYLQRPTFKNRLVLLGFTSRGYDKIGILKEILLGLSFGVIGIFLVSFASIATEIVLESLFNIEIISESANIPTDDIDVIISGADIFGLVLLTAVMLLVVGTSEEILFRGFMQKGLVRNFGEKWGIFITAFIFAIIHLITLIFIAFASPFEFFIIFLLMFVPYLAISLLLGLLFKWRNENLIAVVLTHGLYNSITIIISFIAYNAPQALLMFIFILLLMFSFSLIIYFYLQNFYQRNSSFAA
ncbi:MAG: CPBP family intramembrane glutamic endopeptidase [Promethearchaeota archaeon]